YRYMTEVFKEVAKKEDVIYSRTIPWGYSETFTSFPGTISLRPETLEMLLEDHIDSLVKFGLDHFMFVCGHKGNLPILEQLGRNIRKKHGLRVATIEPLSWFSDEWKEKTYNQKDPWIGHGSDPMMSISMHLFPDDVRTDLLESGQVTQWDSNVVKGTQLTTNGNTWHMYFNYDELTPNGVSGDAKLANEDIGRKAFNRMVSIASDIVKQFSNMNTKI